MDNERSEAPFDGEIPENHPNTYSILLNSHCFKQRPEIIRFLYSPRNRRLTCGTCYSEWSYNQGEELRAYTDWHSRGHSTNAGLFCHACRIPLTTKRPAIDCGICTEKILEKQKK